MNEETHKLNSGFEVHGLALNGWKISRRGEDSPPDLKSGFTLIEILVVCAIIGIVMTIAIPSVYRTLHSDSMDKAVMDFMEGCSHARAGAILGGSPVDLVITATEDNRITFNLQPAGAAASPPDSIDSPSVSGGAWRMDDLKKNTGGGSGGGAPSGAPINFSGTLPESVKFELLEVNFQDAMEWAEARVRFYPNGTCDEFKVLLLRYPTAGENRATERRLITLEVVTALADVESDYAKMR